MKWGWNKNKFGELVFLSPECLDVFGTENPTGECIFNLRDKKIPHYIEPKVYCSNEIPKFDVDLKESVCVNYTNGRETIKKIEKMVKQQNCNVVPIIVNGFRFDKYSVIFIEKCGIICSEYDRAIVLIIGITIPYCEKWRNENDNGIKRLSEG